MSEMIERATNAIYEKYESYPRYAVRQMNSLLAEDLARAAIEAIREPTEAMIDATLFAVQPHSTAREADKSLYRAMIDAALSEATPLSPDLKASQRPTVSSETHLTRPPSQPGRADVARAILKSREFSDARIEYFKTHDLGVWIEACKAADAIRDLYALTKGTEPGAVTDGRATYTEICMNEKCPRGGRPVEVVRNSTDE